MFRSNFRFRKNKTSQDFTVFDPHSTKGFRETDKKYKKLLGRHGDDYIGFVSIDPGTVNLGFDISYFWDTGILQTQTLDKLDFSTEEKSTEDTDIKIYNEAIRKLEPFIEPMSQTHYILIESQLSINPNAVRIMQHLITYLCVVLKDKGVKPLIIEISPELKTSLLGGPVGKLKGESKAKAKTRRKKWCLEKSVSILNSDNSRVTDEILELIQKKRSKRGEGRNKRDDMGDVVCQIVAFLVLCSESEWWVDFIVEGIDIFEIFDIPRI